MKNKTLFLPGFHLQTLRRTPRSARQKLADEQARIRRYSLGQLGECFARFIPKHLFAQNTSGRFSRQRVFNKRNTFWAFFSQVLDADGGCQEVNRKIQAYAATKGLALPSSSTSAYWPARAKLEVDFLDTILSDTGAQLQASGEKHRWKQRRVVVVDGTGVSMPDTPANQAVWPQHGRQQPGCGFPQARVCACFCLASGALISHRLGDRRTSELAMLRDQWAHFEPGDIMLGDKGFCSYYDVWQLQQRSVDSVFTLARRAPVTPDSCVQVLGENDLLIRWPKPRWNPRSSYSYEQWQAMPEYLSLRQIKVTVEQPGFRVQRFYLITTLTNPLAYHRDELADLYYRRWAVELFFRDIKTTLGMDILRCRSPEGVIKELLMHLIAYNAIRSLMLEAANNVGITPNQISFKASLQALRQWEPQLNQAACAPAQYRSLRTFLQTVIADAQLIHRPGRREPRCVKRRPKNFARLNRPRHLIQEIPHRNHYRAERA